MSAYDPGASTPNRQTFPVPPAPTPGEAPIPQPTPIPQQAPASEPTVTMTATPAPAPLAPPSQSFTLEVPGAPEAVVATQAPAMAPPVTAEQRPALDAKVSSFITALISEQTGSPEFGAQADAVRSMGDADIRRAAEMSNRLLETPLREMKTGGITDVSKVSNTLVELRRTVEALDPSKASVKKKFLGLIPYGEKMQDYFRKYQSSQEHLNAILHALRQGQDELTRDNISLNMEKQVLWDTMSRLNQYIYLAEQLDAQLTTAIAQLQVTDPAKADALNKDLLFYVRQKHQDLLTQLAVSIQGYLAMDVVIKNNVELIKGVDRASTTTVSALRTAVITSQALGNQKMVLDQISALNSTTSDLIASTSELLKTNSVTIQEQAASSTISLDALQKAFANIYETMDSIDTFKIQALHSMSQTVGVLENEVAKSRAYLERAARSDANAQLAAESFTLPDEITRG